MLTDKPHYDSSSLSRSRSAVPLKPSSHMGDYIEDKVVVSKMKSPANRVNGTPTKNLIAQEVSKEMNYKLSPSNVVAKLMGLDLLPQPPSNTSAQRRNSKSRLGRSLSHEGIAMGYWEQDFNHGFQDLGVYNDVNEILQHPGKLNNCRSSTADNERYRESEKKMEIIREKFMDAKCLVTNEKLRHSKEFQDAMEVLSSNKELFLKFLQESNNFDSEHLHDFQTIPPSPETKRITILKPSKTDDEKLAGIVKKISKQTKKRGDLSSSGSKNSEPGLPLFNQMVEEYPTRSTRIVVLKPSSAKDHFSRALNSPCPTSPRGVHGEGYKEKFDDFEERNLRDVAKKVAMDMRRNLMEHQLDETVQSSVFSNGYIGDNSSFNRSEDGYMVENLSDSEIMSPVSKHSWDHINRYDSPFFSSPFSRTSYSPESSVCKEAKKRLSERWVSMASNGNFQEHKGTHKSSSTLGQMLALSDLRNEIRIGEASDGNEQGPRVSTSCLASNLTVHECDSNSLKSLERSKSVPESSSVYNTSIDLKVADTCKSKAKVPTKSLKWSLKGKVSNFFFSRNNKAIKEKSNASVTPDDARTNNEHCMLTGTEVNQRTHAKETDLSIAKPTILGNANKSNDQSYPISVVETLFDEDDRFTPESSFFFKSASTGPEISLKANLINKSPPIGSIARTILSSDESRTEQTTTIRYSSKSFASLQDSGDTEEDWSHLVNTLISAANLNTESFTSNSLYKWHSMQSPLEPSLRTEYTKTGHEAKRLRLSSKRKLVFDLMNSLLLELTTEYHHQQLFGFSKRKHTTLEMHVRTRMHEWFMDDGKVHCWDEDGDLCSSVVDRAARAEAAEGGWPENKRGEIGNVGEELEMKLLKELLDEALTDLINGYY